MPHESFIPLPPPNFSKLPSLLTQFRHSAFTSFGGNSLQTGTSANDPLARVCHDSIIEREYDTLDINFDSHGTHYCKIRGCKCEHKFFSATSSRLVDQMVEEYQFRCGRGTS